MPSKSIAAEQAHKLHTVLPPFRNLGDIIEWPGKKGEVTIPTVCNNVDAAWLFKEQQF